LFVFGRSLTTIFTNGRLAATFVTDSTILTKRMPTLSILADENIPLVRELFRSMGDVRVVPGEAISGDGLESVDVLLVRSVTQVDADLLAKSAVRFVGSATTGMDHIDTAYLRHRGIGWASAPGSNAESVVEYVLSVLLRLAVRRAQGLRGKTIGIIGCGNIGGRLALRVRALGMNVLENDPPRALAAEAAGRQHSFLPIDAVLSQADIVTCHVPLGRGEPHRTWHLLGPEELEALAPGSWLVNASRGPVVDNEALLRALLRGDGRPDAVALDVWENEPAPCAELVARVDVATPHIAGYSYEGKIAGTLMLLEALAHHIGIPMPPPSAAVDSSELLVGAPDPTLEETDWLHHLVCRMYDVAADDRRMRAYRAAGADMPTDHFTLLRRTYPARRTFGAYRLREAQIPARYRIPAAEGIGIRVVG
jgi:erythronate-4-phosphate dehydrogenase